MSATPVDLKSATLPVTTVMPCTMAVAAIRASRSARGSGTCSRARFRATAASTESVRSPELGPHVPIHPASKPAPLFRIAPFDARFADFPFHESQRGEPYRADRIEEFFNIARICVVGTRPTNERVGMVTVSGRVWGVEHGPAQRCLWQPPQRRAGVVRARFGTGRAPPG